LNFGGDALKLAQTKVMKAGTRIALALSVMLFLPAAYADSTITLTSPNAQHVGLFGFSVAINQNDPIVVVGAPFETANAQSEAGNAYALDTTTGLIATLTSPNAQITGRFGYSVSISGTTVVVGAPTETANALSIAGHAYVFDSSTGSPIASLTSPYAQASGEFGVSVSVSCTTVVVGAPGETANGQAGAGHAYSFDASTGFLTTTLTSPNAQLTAGFGLSVAVSGTTVVAGAPRETGGGFTQAGHAYIFP
jgi:hypothetical protein